MRNRVICHLCLAGIMLYLAAGCETTFEQKGRDVKFTASSRGSVSTKTAYGDETSDGYAIIEWKANDRIRIYSPNTTYLIGSEGSAEVIVGEGDGQTEYPVVYDDYTLVPGDITGHIHNATLKNVGVSDNENPDGRGLYWNVSEGQANFYSAYPTDVGIGWYEGGLTFELKIPNDQDPFAETPKPQFNTLPLLAMQSGVSSGQKVNLEFYPAFTAFEFNLKSEDLITLNSFTLETSSDNCYVTGTCFYNPALTKKTGDNFYIKNDQIYFVAPIPEFPTYWDGTSYELCKKSLTINFPTGTQIGPAVGETPAKEVTFTLFALPNDLDQMSITVNLTTTDGSTKSRKLKLQQKDSNNEFQWITFPAGHKAKIKGLAVDGGSKWKLNIKADVLDWTFYDEPLSSLNQINVNPIDDDNHTVKVTGSIETTSKWLEDHPDTGSNHELPNDVPEDDPSYYARYYQVRTLNWSQAPEKQFFEMSFTPTAPIGGYWQMIPEYPDQSSVGHFRFEVKIEKLTGWEEQDVPHAQIIDKRVFIRIYPVYENDDDHIYEMTLKCYFSPNKSFDPTYSADSELQDVHKKGDFSYWRFRLERYAGGPYTVSAADEHESLKP
ncbi:MAG: hypothetical protein IJL68_03590 [Bacteroidales bacterium]|nr:hypothetical protein [Bacteroidales bacterium]